MTRFPRIRALIDSWTNPPAVVPLRWTWGEWAQDVAQWMALSVVLGFLHSAESLLHLLEWAVTLFLRK